jgi:hypothetical protein
MILPDRNRPDGPRKTPVMPPESPLPAPRLPAPRAHCPGCSRPIANYRSPTCVYCGVPVPTGLRMAPATAHREAIPPTVLMLLEPRPDDGQARRLRFMLRFVAVVLAVLAIAYALSLLKRPTGGH